MGMARCLSVGCIAGALIAGLPAAAFAQAETTTFTYDALGRVIESESVQPSGPDATHGFAYDDADNRVSQTVSQTASAAPPEGGEASEPEPPESPE